jgi:periplasmic divalent cation tolerance protein
VIKVVYITFPNQDSAVAISNQLLEKRLVACSNIYQMESAYHWQGSIDREKEWVAVFKTTSDKIPEITKLVEENHPYEVPCIVHWNAKANEAYAKWVHDETR